MVISILKPRLQTAFYKFVQITEYYYITPSETNDWNWATAIHIILTGFFLLSQCPPYAHIWGLCVPMRPFKYAEAPKQRKFGVLRVCLVTKGSNFQVSIYFVFLIFYCYALFHFLTQDVCITDSPQFGKPLGQYKLSKRPLPHCG